MAITYVAFNHASGGAGSLSFTMPGPVAVGDLLVAMVGWPGTTTADVTPVISDNLNTGAWNLPASLHLPLIANNLEQVMAWIRCDTAGTPTITASSLGTQGSDFVVVQYTGFVHGPALVAADITTNSGTGTSPTATGLTNSFANELTLAFAACGGNQNFSALTGNVTANSELGAAGTCFGDIVNATSGNALTFGGTITSAHWAVMLASFQDAVTGGAALVAGAQAIANGSGSITTGPGGYAPVLLDDPAHAGGSDQISMGSGPGTGTGDTAFVAFTKLKQWAGDANTNFAKLFQVRSLLAPVTGFAIAAAKGLTMQILNPAGTLATGTITFPPTPGDQQPYQVMTSQTVTALALNTSDGTTINAAPTTLAANSSVKWRFVAALNTWFREQ